MVKVILAPGLFGNMPHQIQELVIVFEKAWIIKRRVKIGWRRNR